MSDGETFDYLVIGLAKLLQQDCKYPYPELFQRACNVLALKMREISYPRTLAGLFNLLEEPVKTWYPFPVPQAFDSDFGLTYDGQLSEEASRYFYDELLERTQLPESASVVTQQLAIENDQFRKLLDCLREKHDHDPELAQKEYVLLRSFLIENPYTTTAQLREKFGRTQYIKTKEVGNLYDDCDENVVYWNCDRCGPLAEKYGRLHGVKPSVCNDHRDSLSYVRRIAWERELRQIKRGIHLRVCLPGIHELQLFRKLEALQQAHQKQLCAVLLYPGLDRYDIQLRFGDETVWAIDVKDYRNPYQLAAKLLPIYGEGTLQYNESFYVLPINRVLSYDNYVQIAREEATKLPLSTRILSDAEFEQRVITKISSLEKGK
jgi:hypothetical protein